MEDIFEILLLIHHSVDSAWNNAFLGSDLGHFIFNITKMFLSYRNDTSIYCWKKKKSQQYKNKQQINSQKISLGAAWLNSSGVVIIYSLSEL